jgi:hypothetical protein
VTINGQDALVYQPPPDPSVKGKRPKKAPRVSYSRRFEEIEAYTAMGLTATEYAALVGTPYWAQDGELSKSDVLAWWKYHIAIENLRTGIF